MTTWDPTWEAVHSSREWGWEPDRWFGDALRRRYNGNISIDIAGRRDVLDLGCGGGAITMALAQLGFNVVGIDGSPAAIALTERRLREKGLGARLGVVDAGRILETFGPESFDWVIDNACLQCCLPEDQMAISEQIRAVLRPGGWVCSRMVAADSWGDGLGERVGERSYRNIPEGPASGMGLTTFATRDDILTVWRWLDLVGHLTLDHHWVSEGMYAVPADVHGRRAYAKGPWRWWSEWQVEGRKPE